MANSDSEAELVLTARDEASDVVEGVADALDALPETTEVGVDADTRDAETAIERLERELDDVSDDGRELRVTFKYEQLQREIKTILKELDQLEDPLQIQARTDDLERAQTELRDLADLADKQYDIEINADPKRTAQRAAGDLDAMRGRADGLQSAIPALRGFGDEMGGTAQAAGIAGQAVADLGDFSLIMGEKFGISEKASAQLGTALGAAGLLAVGIGVALPLLQQLAAGNDKVAQETAGAADALDDFYGVIQRLQSDVLGEDPILSALLGDEDADELRETGAALNDLGLGIGDVRDAKLRLDSDAPGFFAELAEQEGIPPEFADELARVVDQGGSAAEMLRNFQQAALLAGAEDPFGELSDTAQPVIEDLRTLRNELSADLEAPIVEQLKSAVFAGDEFAATLLDQVIANEITATQAADDWAAAQAAAADATDDSSDAAGDAADTQQDLADRLAETEQAARDAAAAHTAEADAMVAANDARRAATDSFYGVILAQNDLDDATADWLTVQGKAAEGSNEWQESLIRATSAASDLADQQVTLQADTAAAAGETVTQTASTDQWNTAMLQAAQAADGPLRRSIVDYIASVNGIPPEKVSEILADLDEEGVQTAKDTLDETSETREAAIIADAETEAAQSELDGLAEPRTAVIYGDVTIRRNVRWDQESGEFVPTSYRALAAPVAAPAAAGLRSASPATTGVYLAGDRLAGSDDRQVTVDRSTHTVNVTMPSAVSARDVIAQLDAWERRNGRRLS